MTTGVDRTVVADVVVVGSGAAGLTVALGAAPRRVAVLTPGRLGSDGSSAWAQGGIAAALGTDDDPRLHAEDTETAGAGLVEPEAARLLTHGAAEGIRRLRERGARFDVDGVGEPLLGREAAHCRRRILHANGDATGAEVMRALRETARRAGHLTLHEETRAVEIVTDTAGGRTCGVLAVDGEGHRVFFRASAVVLATGGLGALYRYTTNPPWVRGEGLALAARAGARLVDLEFVQFHPTALRVDGDTDRRGRPVGRTEPLPLLTEALRGEGAVLIDETGHRFMPEVHPDAELAPRDVVARAIHHKRREGGEAFLDARAAVGARFPERFPTVYAACRERGIDPRTEPMPVTPAAHYHMGGVATDLDGRSSLPGLWAVGEVAATGVHGANRLASNSLLEALVMGGRVAEDVRHRSATPHHETTVSLPGSGYPGDGPESETDREVRRLLWDEVGLLRDGDGLEGASRQLEDLEEDASPAARNLLTVARLVTASALAREESRGGHSRRDFPETDPRWERRIAAWLDPQGGVETEVGPRLGEVPRPVVAAGGLS